MSALKYLLEREQTDYINQLTEQSSTLNYLLTNKLYNLIKYVETKDLLYLRNETEKLKAEQAAKENVEPNSTITLQEKTKNKVSLLQVKQEKLSLMSSVPSVASSVISETSRRENEILKSEMEMPAPLKLPAKTKKIKMEPLATIRSSRTKSKLLEKSKEMNKGKPSDVIIQNTTITMIDITDDKDSEKEITDDEQSKPEEWQTRSTRSKTRQQKKQQEAEQNTKDIIDFSAMTNYSFVKNRNLVSSGIEEECLLFWNCGIEELLPSTPPHISEKAKNAVQNILQIESPKSTEAIQNKTITIKEKNQNKAHGTEKKGKNATETYNDAQLKTNKQTLRTTRAITRHLTKQQEEAERSEQLELEPVEYNKRSRTNSNNEKSVKESPKISKSISASEDVNSFRIESENQNAIRVNNSTITLQESNALNNYNIPKSSKSKTQDFSTYPTETLKKQQSKEIFNPYEKTSIKKKVDAFEKFGSASNKTEPVKIKANTPFSSKFMPQSCSTSRIDKTNPNKQKNPLKNDSGLSMKSLTAIKASQAEFREREKRRQDKEKEAQLKKEALLLAQAEERRRKREEKQLKVQQQRILLQKEKETLLEFHKLKDGKHKLRLAKEEDKIQKNRDADKTRSLTKNKTELLKEMGDREVAYNDQNNNKEQQKKAMTNPQERALPIYMTTSAPLLPTEDCYDSDSDEYRPCSVMQPLWAQDPHLSNQLYAQLISGEKIKNTLFLCTNSSPDLAEIFESIDPKKLTRTSSAQWKAPPRYTLFAETSNVMFSEDSDH